MKNLFVGLSIFFLGICFGVAIFFGIFQPNGVFEKNQTTKTISPINGTGNFLSQDGEDDVKFFKNIANVSSFNDVKAYVKDSYFSLSLAYYALKQNKKDLWTYYWLEIFSSLGNENKIFTKEQFLETINSSYEDIKNGTFDIGKYPNLLDGSIIWSNASLENKISECKKMFVNFDDPLAEKSCIAKSQLFEVYIKNLGTCENIEDETIKLYCKELVSL